MSPQAFCFCAKCDTALNVRNPLSRNRITSLNVYIDDSCIRSCMVLEPKPNHPTTLQCGPTLHVAKHLGRGYVRFLTYCDQSPHQHRTKAVPLSEQLGKQRWEVAAKPQPVLSLLPSTISREFVGSDPWRCMTTMQRPRVAVIIRPCHRWPCWLSEVLPLSCESLAQLSRL